MKELAADRIPVAVTCRVLKLARQPYYRWLDDPVTTAEYTEAHRANALFDSTPTAMIRSSATATSSRKPAMPARRWPSGPPGGSARITDGGVRLGRRSAARTARPARRSTTIWSAASSPHQHRMRCGWPTSPNTAPTRASSICARSRTCSPTASSDTASTLIRRPPR